MIIKDLGLQDYLAVWEAMKTFTEERSKQSPDEIWFVEHPPVYTQGRNGKAEHLLSTHHIPVIQVDRGGQVTYHGPGQIVMYLLINIRRINKGVRHVVHSMEKAVLDTLNDYALDASLKGNAPGVYIHEKKIAQLGLRVKKHCTYHGLSLNIDMDLRPFTGINPCGYQNLEVVQLTDYINPVSIAKIKTQLTQYVLKHLDHPEKTPVLPWEKNNERH